MILTLAAGCGRDDVKVYQVAKEPTPGQAQSMEMPPGHPDISSSSPPRSQIQWKLPAGWQEGKPSSMRAASFTVRGDNDQSADVAVIPLPQSGNDLELVNMWRSQMQLAPASAANAEMESELVLIGDTQGKLFEIASEAPVIEGVLRGRILVAKISKDGLDWFFKMSGEESLVAAQKPAFIEFLKSVSFEEPAPTAMAARDPHEGHAHAPGEPHAPGSSEKAVPAGWKEAPAGQFLVAKYVIEEGGAQAAVNVSLSGGGLLMNVNRWRVQQLGLTPATQADLAGISPSLDTAGGKATVIELDGKDASTGQDAKLIAAIVPRGEQALYFKLMGDPKLVGAQKDAFLKFVQKADY